VTTYYTGSAWANLDTTGMTNPMTTTGDTIYSSSGSTPARLGIGTAGQVLQVNSGATAPEWATPAGGGQNFSLLNSGGTALTGASVSITGISGLNTLQILIKEASSTSTAAFMEVQFNSDTTAANYKLYGLYIPSLLANEGDFNESAGAFPYGRMSGNAGSTVSGSIRIEGCNTSGTKTAIMFGSGNPATGTQAWAMWYGGLYAGTSTISSVQLRPSAGTFDSGRVYIYGSA
jgi:hypothetical protein